MRVFCRQRLKNNKSFFGVIFCAMLVALCSAVQAQQPKKFPTIGVLSGTVVIVEPIRRALGEIGYVDGKNILIEHRSSGGKLDRLPELAAQLVRLNVDLIVATGGLPTVQAAKNATKTIPIVMAGRGIDPVVSGLVESLAYHFSALTNPLISPLTLSRKWLIAVVS